MSSDYSNLFQNNYDNEDLNDIIKNQFLKLSGEMLPTIEDNLKLYENIEIQKSNIFKIEEHLQQLESKIDFIYKEIQDYKDKIKSLEPPQIIQFKDLTKENLNNIINDNLHRIENLFNIKIENIYEELNKVPNNDDLNNFKAKLASELNFKVKSIENQIFKNNKECLELLKSKLGVSKGTSIKGVGSDKDNNFTLKEILPYIKNHSSRIKALEEKIEKKANVKKKGKLTKLNKN